MLQAGQAPQAFLAKTASLLVAWNLHHYPKLTPGPVRLHWQAGPGPGPYLLTLSLLKPFFRAAASRSSLQAASGLELRGLGKQEVDAPTQSRELSQGGNTSKDEWHRLQPTRDLPGLRRSSRASPPALKFYGCEKASTSEPVLIHSHRMKL